MKLRWVFLVIFVISVRVVAQETPTYAGYRLRQPSLTEYLETVLSLARQEGNFTTFDEYFRLAELPINFEIRTRYPLPWQTNLQLLYDVYAVLGSPEHSLHLNTDEWLISMTDAWLRENNVLLADSPFVHFEDVSIWVTPRDFNGDGINEYLLDITKGGDATRGLTDRLSCPQYTAQYLDYFVVEETSSGYRYVDVPVPQVGLLVSEAGNPVGNTYFEELGFEDINSDGLPEWLVLSRRLTFGTYGYPVNAGKLYVFGWRNSQIVDLTASTEGTTEYAELAVITCAPPEPYNVRWELTNIDTDPALEILQHQMTFDVWYCESEKTRVFDWNASVDEYQLSREDAPIFANTQNCAQRAAEAAMRSGDIAGALRLYEQALALPQFENQFGIRFPNVDAEMNQYLRFRLALAYSLSGQLERAGELMQSLAAEPPTSDLMAELISAYVEAYERDPDPLMLCVAGYETASSLRGYSLFIDGDMRDLTAEFVSPDIPYQPATIGCDAPNMLYDTFSEHSFVTSETPISQLTELGFVIDHSISADLDHDGTDEWLVWLETRINPIFFVEDGETFRVSFPYINPYRKYDRLHMLELPNNAGTALVFLSDYFSLDYDEQWRIREDKPTGDCPSGTGMEQWIRIWRMVEHELQQIVDDLGCVPSFDDLFPSGHGSDSFEVYGTTYTEDGIRTRGYYAYTWSETELTFLLPAGRTLTAPERIVTGQQPFLSTDVYEFYIGDYEGFVENSEDLQIRDLTDRSSLPPFEAFYLRAVALEMLHRPDEALEIYVALYEAPHNPAWEALLALHLEQVE